MVVIYAWHRALWFREITVSGHGGGVAAGFRDWHADYPYNPPVMNYRWRREG